MTLRALVAVALTVTSFSFASATTSDPGSLRLGLMYNGGQWPSHVIAVAHTRGVDLWITTTGVICDEYTIKDNVRTGFVYQELFAGATLLDQTRDAEHTRIAMFRGGMQAPLTTYASSAQPVRFRYPSGAVLSLSVGPDGRIGRTIEAGMESLASTVTIKRFGGLGHQINDATKAGSFVYGSYIGGGAFDAIFGIELASTGNFLVSGSTAQLTVPAGVGGYSKSIKADIDAFVLLCDPKFQRIIAMTFIGGNAADRTRAMNVDGTQNVYLAIETTSNDMPTTPAAQFKTLKAGTDAYVAKFDSTLTKLLTGFYHGGNREDVPRGIDVDEAGLIYLAGGTTSTANFPNNMTPTANLVWQYQDGRDTRTKTVPISSGISNLGQSDGFIAIYSPTGSMQKSRYYGREGNEVFTGVTVDSRGYVVLTGTTTSTSFESVPIADPTWNGRLPYDRTFNGGTTDAFVVKMTSGLTFSQTDGVTFSTLFGGNREDEPVSLWLDADGRIFIGGNTTSTNMPTSGSVYSTPLGQQDGFVAQIADNGTQVLGCTYIGGSGNDIVRKVRPSNRTSAFLVSGSTSSSDFSTEGFGVTTERFGLTDGFVTMMNFASLTVSTLLTGLESDTVVDAVLDFRGDILIAANSTSTNLFKHDSAYAGYSGASDGYLTKFAPGSLEIVTPKGGEVYCVGASRPLAWDASGVTDTTKFRIEYSLEGSGKWSELVKSVGGRSYLWKIPANTPAGSYILRISTVNGHVSTLTTPFTIDVAPTITKQPTSTVVCQGARLSLSVTSSSVASKYQWRKDGVNIQGATSETLTVDTAAASSAGRYDCVITGECPPAITTQPATVTVTPRPAVTTQPVSQTVDEGKPLSLSVVAAGVGLSYQWKRDGSSINGATNPTLSISSATKADGGSYVCEVAGSCGSVSTQAAVVKVNSGTSVQEVESAAGRMTVIGPQPATDAVMIGLQLDRPQELTARLFDAQGRALATLPLGLFLAGDHVATLSVAYLSEGVVMLEVSSEISRWVLPVVIRR
jgi:hypothetical protein